MKSLSLHLDSNVYPVKIGQGAVAGLPRFLKSKKVAVVFLLSDRSLRAHRAAVVEELHEAGIVVHEIAVKAGEELKEFSSVYPIYGELLKRSANRKSVLIALGGGTVGDVAGFVAATYMRGIEWIGLPTTLLAQVDSAIGGKTGINHESGKNLIGAFHQPMAVFCDTDFLSTLSPREIISGFGEIIKYGITFDETFFSYLEKNERLLLERNPKVLETVIYRSLEWKVKTVEQDERDQAGIREVLNFGHTFAHALEKVTHFKAYQHGEAVIVGMRFAIFLSVVRHALSLDEAKRIDALLKRFPVPGIKPHIKRQDIFKAMKKDKKAEGDKIRFVLLKRIGETFSDKEVTDADLESAYSILKLGGLE